MIDAKVYAERLEICKSCEYYRLHENRCVKVAVPDDPTRRGRLDHPLGIGNPKTRCPVRKFNFIPSAHAKLVQEYITWELTENQLYQLTRVGIIEANVLTWMSYIYDEFLQRGFQIKRSTIAQRLNAIRRTINN